MTPIRNETPIVAEGRPTAVHSVNRVSQGNFFATFGAWELFCVARSHWKVLAVPVLLGQACAILACFFAVKFSSTSTILIQRPGTSGFQALSTELGGLKSGLLPGGKGSYDDALLLYLRSHDFFLSLAKSLNEDPEGAKALALLKNDGSRPGNRTTIPDLAALISTVTRFNKGEPSTITLTTTTASAELSFALNQLILEYSLKRASERELGELDDAAEYVSSKLKETSEQMRLLDEQILEVQRHNPQARTGRGRVLAGANSVSAELEASRVQLEQNEQMIRQLTRQLRADSNGKPARDTSSKNSTARQLGALKSRRQQAINQGMSADSNFIRELDSELNRLEAKSKGKQTAENRDFELIDDNLNPVERIEDLRKRNWALRVKIDGAVQFMKQRLKDEESSSRDEQRFLAITKGIDLQYGLFAELTRQLFQLDVQRIAAQKRISVLENPAPETVTRSPKLVPTLPLALLLSLILAGFLISIQESHDPLILGVNEVRRLHAAFAGTIPDFRGIFYSRRYRIRSWRALLSQHQQEVPISLAFKKVRTRLLQLNKGAPSGARLIAVHSHRTGEGKSYICANLAASLSTLNGRVLVIDGDSRMRALTKALGTSDKVGLTELLKTSKEPFDKYVLNILPNLDLLPAGEYTPNSTELFQSPRFTQVLADLRAKYEYIVLDTPPWLSVSDAPIMAGHADINLLTARVGVTRVGEVNDLIDDLAVSARNIFLVLNGSRGTSHLQYGQVG